MSKLSRALARIKRDLEGDVRWYHTIGDNFWSYWDHCALNKAYYKCRAFVLNLYLFLGLAWHWRPWDSHYTIDVLVKLLKKQAKCLKENDNHVGAQRVSRRCYTAAGLLDKAYNRDIDKTVLYCIEKRKLEFRQLDNSDLYTLEDTGTFDRRIIKGMEKIATAREKKSEAEAKKEAWAYLCKYVEHFWD